MLHPAIESQKVLFSTDNVALGDFKWFKGNESLYGERKFHGSEYFYLMKNIMSFSNFDAESGVREQTYNVFLVPLISCHSNEINGKIEFLKNENARKEIVRNLKSTKGD